MYRPRTGRRTGLDRIDLHVEVPRVKYEKLGADTLAESSAMVRGRVEAARQRQWTRFTDTRVASNVEMGIRKVKHFCASDLVGEALLKAVVQRLGLSAWAYHRVLKVARTIADLAEARWSTSVHWSRGAAGRVVTLPVACQVVFDVGTPGRMARPESSRRISRVPSSGRWTPSLAGRGQGFDSRQVHQCDTLRPPPGPRPPACERSQVCSRPLQTLAMR
jgi:hypothetical protein